MQILLPDGEETQLSLADPQQQLQAVKDLLQRQLIHTAVQEQHASPGNDWFMRAAGVSANTVLTTCSHHSSPRHTLAVLASLLGCYMRVRLPGREPSRPPPTKRPRSTHPYLHVHPPEQGASCEAGRAEAAALRPRKGMMLQLILRRDEERWLFEVVSSTMVSSTKRASLSTLTATELEQNEDEYAHCAICGGDGELMCCDGVYCTVAMHASHLSQEQQEARGGQQHVAVQHVHFAGQGPAQPQAPQAGGFYGRALTAARHRGSLSWLVCLLAEVHELASFLG